MEAIPATLEALRVPLSSLKCYGKNPRTGDVDAIAESLKANGQYRPIVVNERTNEVLAGNHTLKAARKLGWSEIAATFVDVDEEQAARIVLVDNRSNDLAEYDDSALVELLQDIEDLSGSGFSQEDLDELLAKVEPEQIPPVLPPEDTEPAPPPKEPVTKRGDIWLLGPHRLICGDCRDYGDLERLMAGSHANIVFTSPPYASQREYDPSSGFVPIRPDEYVDWWEEVQANVRSVLAEDGSFFVNIKAHAEGGQRHLYVLDLVLAHVRRWGWRFVDDFAWVRQGVPGRWTNRFKNGHEPVFHFTMAEQIKFRPESVAHESDDVVSYSPDNRKTHSGFISGSASGRESGMALPNNVLKIATARADPERGHTAEFPVQLPEFFVKAFTDEGDRILDPFMGSGTSIIAAHNTGRIGYGVELSPAYCDVILNRFQRHTGEKPVLESTGDAHDFGG